MYMVDGDANCKRDTVDNWKENFFYLCDEYNELPNPNTDVLYLCMYVGVGNYFWRNVLYWHVQVVMCKLEYLYGKRTWNLLHTYNINWLCCSVGGGEGSFSLNIQKKYDDNTD